MQAKDVGRILAGARLVIDQAITKNQPEVVWRLERAQQHLVELCNVMVDLAKEQATMHSDATKKAANNGFKSSEVGGAGEANKGTTSTQSAAKASGKSKDFHAAYASPPVAPATSHVHATSSSSDLPSDLVEDIAAQVSTIQKEVELELAHIKSPKTSATTSSESANIVENDLIGFSHIIKPQQSDTDSVDKKSQSQKSSQMRERAVPSTPLGRMVGFGSLAMRMAMGAAVDRASYAFSGETPTSGISEQNAERLAEALCRMRGAALKLGQILSLSDEDSLPPTLAKALDRVRHAADYMPQRQLDAQIRSQLGPDWRSKFSEFDMVPIAAASIGQVHRAKLLDGRDVAMKIQYPGVAESIDSDLLNLKRLVNMTNLLPPGLFIDSIIKVAGDELAEECDYIKEAESQMRYREFISNDKTLRKHVNVPAVVFELCSDRVLTSEWVPGGPIDQAASLPQPVRNAIARTMLIKTVRELFEWRFIQSDPNYANFLYDDSQRMINMIDFGAARQYEKPFVDGYMHLVWAAANRDRDTILKVSKDLGFITGDETKEFVDAHVDAGLVVGEPFLLDEPFDFGNSRLTARIGAYGDTFLKFRLTPPPTEAYSLHRKLGGAFMLCIKLKAHIKCRDILEKTFQEYKFGLK